MSHRLLVPGLSLLAVLATLAGCAVATADEETGAEPLGSAGQAIMGGQDDATDVGVVDVLWSTGSDGYAECSGSLLAPNMVLTAHHCVSPVNNGASGIYCSSSSFAAPDAVTNFFVSTQEFRPANLASYHTVSEVVLPPGSTNSTYCGVDQAILILSDNIAPTEAVPLVPRVDSEIAAGDVYSAVGFGITSFGAMDSGTRRRLDDLVIDCVGEACTAIVGDAIDPQHELLGEDGICEGDSGGPALDQQSRVVGVTSRGGADCTTAPIYGDVYSWAGWIQQTAAHAAQVGNYTPPPWVTGYPTDPEYSYAVGGACGGSACPSNLCLADADGEYCTRLCETAAPCPTGYTCQSMEDHRLCQRDPPSATTTLAGDPSARSGCSVEAADPTKPVPWFLSGVVAALALLRRRRPR